MGPSEVAFHQHVISPTCAMSADYAPSLGGLSGYLGAKAKRRPEAAGVEAPLSSRDPRLVSAPLRSLPPADAAMSMESTPECCPHQRLKTPRRSHEVSNPAFQVRALDQQQVATLELDSSTGSQKPVAGLTSSDCSESSGTSKSPFTGVEVPIALVPGKLAWPTASCSQSAGSFNKSSLDGTKEGQKTGIYVENALLQRVLSAGFDAPRCAEEVVSHIPEAPGLILLADIANQGSPTAPEIAAGNGQRGRARPQRQRKQNVRRLSTSPARSPRVSERAAPQRQAFRPDPIALPGGGICSVQQLVEEIRSAKETMHQSQSQPAHLPEQKEASRAALLACQKSSMHLSGLDKHRRSRSAKEAILNAPQCKEAGGYACPVCGARKTPLWRWDEELLVCNACGLRKQQASSKRGGASKRRLDQALVGRAFASRDGEKKIAPALISLTNRAACDEPGHTNRVTRERYVRAPALNSVQHSRPTAPGTGPGLFWGTKRKRSNVD